MPDDIVVLLLDIHSVPSIYSVENLMYEHKGDDTKVSTGIVLYISLYIGKFHSHSHTHKHITK